MILDDVAKELHESQDRCYACSGKFSNDKVETRMVRDHCILRVNIEERFIRNVI